MKLFFETKRRGWGPLWKKENECFGYKGQRIFDSVELRK